MRAGENRERGSQVGEGRRKMVGVWQMTSVGIKEGGRNKVEEEGKVGGCGEITEQGSNN